MTYPFLQNRQFIRAIQTIRTLDETLTMEQIAIDLDTSVSELERMMVDNEPIVWRVVKQMHVAYGVIEETIRNGEGPIIPYPEAEFSEVGEEE